MTDRDKLKAHADLLAQTAEQLGVDLAARARDGDVSVDLIGEAVLRCAGCSDPEACRQRLNAGQVPMNAPLSFCRNTDLLSVLRAGKIVPWV